MKIRSFTDRLKRFWKKTSRNGTYAAEWRRRENIRVKNKSFFNTKFKNIGRRVLEKVPAVLYNKLIYS